MNKNTKIILYIIFKGIYFRFLVVQWIDKFLMHLPILFGAIEVLQLSPLRAVYGCISEIKSKLHRTIFTQYQFFYKINCIVLL